MPANLQGKQFLENKKMLCTKRILKALCFAEISLLIVFTLSLTTTQFANAADTFVIKASADTHSTIYPSGNVSVGNGSSQSFTFSGNAGYTVTSVLVDGVSVNTSSPYTFSNIQANRTISVSASINTYYITSSVDSHSTINPLGRTAVTYGGFQSYTYSASSGYSLTSVLVDGIAVSISGNYNFTNVQFNCSIAVSTTMNNYYINSSADAHSTINPLGSTHVSFGGSQSYTFSAYTGYSIKSVLVDGSPVSAVSPYTFNNIQANHTISVSTSIVAFYVTSSSDVHSRISPSGSTLVNYGSSQTYTFLADNDYRIMSVLVDGVPVNASSPYTFTNVTANHNISVSTFPLSRAYVDPLTATTFTTFAFYVYYYDPSGVSPAKALVLIDDTAYSMIPLISSGTASDGFYSYSTTLSAGNHTFSFAFTKGSSNQTFYSSQFSGPTVTEPNPPAPKPTETQSYSSQSIPIKISQAPTNYPTVTSKPTAAPTARPTPTPAPQPQPQPPVTQPSTPTDPINRNASVDPQSNLYPVVAIISAAIIGVTVGSAVLIKKSQPESEEDESFDYEQF
jgi:hypothetical protein